MGPVAVRSVKIWSDFGLTRPNSWGCYRGLWVLINASSTNLFGWNWNICLVSFLPSQSDQYVVTFTMKTNRDFFTNWIWKIRKAFPSLFKTPFCMGYKVNVYYCIACEISDGFEIIVRCCPWKVQFSFSLFLYFRYRFFAIRRITKNQFPNKSPQNKITVDLAPLNHSFYHAVWYR